MTIEGLVTWTTGNQLKVDLEGIVRQISIPGRMWQTSQDAKPFIVGDRVIVDTEGDEPKIVSILHRKNEFTRRAPGTTPAPLTVAVNVNRVVVIASAAEPETPLGLVDRFFTPARLGGCRT